MVDTLTARFLDRRTIDKVAYPLVRNIVPDMTLARWMQFVRPHLVPRSPDWPRGVMTIQNATGYILSLFAFEVRADLHESRIFYMDHIMIPNLPGRGTLWASTIGAAERLAEMNGCRAIWVEFRGGAERSDKDLLTSLERSGYAPAGVRAFKRLEAKSGRTGNGSDGITRAPHQVADPSGGVVEEVSTSWRRSANEHGLNPDNSEAPRIVTSHELRQLREPLDQLIFSAQEEIDRLYKLVREAGYALLFCDTAGVAVKLGGQTIKSIGHIGRLRRVRDNDSEEVSARDMLTELLDDNRRLAERLLKAHALCDETGDVASASLIEVWIDEAQGRAWFLQEAVQRG